MGSSLELNQKSFNVEKKGKTKESPFRTFLGLCDVSLNFSANINSLPRFLAETTALASIAGHFSSFFGTVLLTELRERECSSGNSFRIVFCNFRVLRFSVKEICFPSFEGDLFFFYPVQLMSFLIDFIISAFIASVRLSGTIIWSKSNPHFRR